MKNTYVVTDPVGGEHTIAVSGGDWVCSCERTYCYAVNSLINTFVVGPERSLPSMDQYSYDSEGNVYNSKGTLMQDLVVSHASGVARIVDMDGMC